MKTILEVKTNKIELIVQTTTGNRYRAGWRAIGSIGKFSFPRGQRVQEWTGLRKCMKEFNQMLECSKLDTIEFKHNEIIKHEYKFI